MTIVSWAGRIIKKAPHKEKCKGAGIFLKERDPRIQRREVPIRRRLLTPPDAHCVGTHSSGFEILIVAKDRGAGTPSTQRNVIDNDGAVGWP